MNGAHVLEIYHPDPHWVPPVLPQVAEGQQNPIKDHFHPEVANQCKGVIDTIREAVTLHLQTLGAVNGSVGSVLQQIHVALHEIFQNAHLHGHGADPNKKIHVSWGIEENELQICIKDEGPGFDFACQLELDPTDPENLFKENGRGILLTRAFTEATWHGNGNEVRLRKSLNAS